MKIAKIVTAVLFLCVVSHPVASFGEVALKKIYGLRDKSRLQNVIAEAEKAMEQNPSDQHSLKVLGIAYHNLGVLKVSGAPKKAEEYLEKSKNASPDDYEVLVYLGSAKTMVARDSWNVFTKISNVNKGVNMIDSAVKKAPDNITLRIVRADNSLALPGSFNRIHFVKEDFLHSEKLIERASSEIDADTRAEVFYQLGMVYKSEGNMSLAKTYFRKAVAISPDSEWGKKAGKEE